MGLLLSLVFLSLGGCAPAPTQRRVPENPEVITAQASNLDWQRLPRLMGKANVVMEVKGQVIMIEVDGDHAPLTAGNFVDLVEQGVYDGLMFHRVIRDPEPFVVQGGDPLSADPEVDVERLGAGSYPDPQTQRPRYIPLEIQPEGWDEPIYSQTLLAANIPDPPILTHRRGAIAMARSQMPDSASAQFYFALSDLLRLDGDYAVFGYVTAGMDIVDRIQPGDRIDSARVISGLERLERPE
ncbi:MAG: peptidylprolyl isomerase [Cyanobacteria bacterium P01_G01_bin.54]